MSRIKISIGIITAIIIIGISGFFMLKKEINKVMADIDKTQELYNSGKTSEALAAADTLLDGWNKFHSHASIYVNNNKISAVQNSISRIKPLIESENDEIGAEFEAARTALNWIIESEIPRITNIL